jgi:Rad3-related DNA helicase
MNDPEFKFHFPFETPRKIQRGVSKRVYEEFKNYKYVILQAPTGIGKSPIAYTLASYMNLHPFNKQTNSGAYILTSMKGLQDQYVNDFNPLDLNTFNTVKGKNNYRCCKDGTLTCETGGCTRLGKMTKEYKDCPYIQARETAYASDMTVLNYSYFFNMAREASIQDRKQLLVLDECHNVEDQLLKFASVCIVRKEFKELNLNFPQVPSLKATNAEMITWLTTSLLANVNHMSACVQSDLVGLCEGDVEFGHLRRQDVFLTNLIEKINCLSAQKVKGVTVVVDRDGNNSISFKPLKADIYANDYLFNNADKVLMMSATVLNYKLFCKNLGLDPKDVKFLSTQSEFKLERRPILDISKCNLSKKTMDVNKYIVADQVKELLETHKHERGVIHSQSYELAEFLVEELGDPRLYIPVGANRDQNIRDFLSDPLIPNGVIVSPSIKEGFDFKDDNARFCILLKAPFANLSDSFVKKRFNEDPEWYLMEALRDVIQSTGRVVRNDEDYAITYLLDGNIKRLVMENRKYVPKYWLDSIKLPDTFKWEPNKFKGK